MMSQKFWLVQRIILVIWLIFGARAAEACNYGTDCFGSCNDPSHTGGTCNWENTITANQAGDEISVAITWHSVDGGEQAEATTDLDTSDSSDCIAPEEKECVELYSHGTNAHYANYQYSNDPPAACGSAYGCSQIDNIVNRVQIYKFIAEGPGYLDVAGWLHSSCDPFGSGCPPDETVNDDSVTVELTLNPHHWFSDTTKEWLKKVAALWTGIAGWTIFAGYETADPFTEGIGVFEGALAGTAVMLYGLDPVDTNYTVVPTIVSAPFTLVVPGSGITWQAANAYNAVLYNEAQFLGVMRATITAINRASGALAAHDTYWVNRQQAAITSFMQLHGYLLANQATTLQNLVNTLNAEGVPSTTVTAAQMQNIENDLAHYGWSGNPSTPNEFTAAHNTLVTAGSDDATNATIASMLYVQIPVDTTWPGVLTAQNSDLQQEASAVQADLPEPNWSLGMGACVLLLAALSRRKAVH